jgi:hypothetical protein
MKPGVPSSATLRSSTIVSGDINRLIMSAREIIKVRSVLLNYLSVKSGLPQPDPLVLFPVRQWGHYTEATIGWSPTSC